MGIWNFEKDGIFVTAAGLVVTIKIDKPETKNGTDWKALYALSEAYERINEDDELRVIVLRGNGEYFYTGGRVNPNDPEDSRMYAKAIAESGASRKGVKLPVIAAVDGHCLKAGMGWLISADMAIARVDVTFAFPEVRMGGVPMMVMAGCMDYIPKKIALKAYYSSEPFDAETALRFGLINEICTAEDFEKTLDRYVHMIIDYPKALIQMTHDAYYAMEAMATKKERVEWARKALAEQVLPQMAKEKQSYNV